MLKEIGFLKLTDKGDELELMSIDFIARSHKFITKSPVLWCMYETALSPLTPLVRTFAQTLKRCCLML